MLLTADLSGWKDSELQLLVFLLKAALSHGIPISRGGLKVHYHPEGEFVFMTNANSEMAMFSQHTWKIEKWYACAKCGEVGFKDVMLANGNLCCKELLGGES